MSKSRPDISQIKDNKKPCTHREDFELFEQFFNFIDQVYQANLAKMTFGISPAALATAYFSWLAQLAQSPGRLMDLALYPMLHMNDCAHKVLADPQPAGGEDVRFRSDAWQSLPWRLYAEHFLQTESWWRHATMDVSGVSNQVERTVSFSVRQLLDALSPANFVMTNPELFKETVHSEGKNLIDGTDIAMKDLLEKISGSAPAGVEHFIPGKDVAITPGRVVYSNHLMELIQYDPLTKDVYKEPVLIVPAWIMKYYILDLSPHHSMVKWLVSQGQTVFMISWRNPGREDRDLSMDDYYRQGVMSAMDQITHLLPKTNIHLMGYCLGGTLALIAAAAMAKNGDHRLKTLTLLAAQGDFTEAGEMMVFITESEIAFLENMMWDQGYLDTKQMAGSFQMLRSYDLIWSKMIQDYMHGTQRGMIDLLAWNADATRMPYKMHSEYLHQLFLDNDFAEGRYTVEGYPVVAKNIQVPVFALSTDKDHIAPWRSVYKIHLMVNSDITFVLTSGGHNAGILSEPGHPDRAYHIMNHRSNMTYISPDDWLNQASLQEGSWWYAWEEWLVKHSSKVKVQAPKVDTALALAPGTYVLQK